MNGLSMISEQNASIKMSSREIAQLCNKEHRHVTRDIETMFLQLNIGCAGYVQIWTHPQNGQSYREFLLPKDLTLTLVSGYNVILRKRIIDRWLELENQQKATALLPDFTNPAESARAWAEEYEQKCLVQQQIKLLEPKARFVDHYVEVGTSKSLRETAKILNFPEKMMIECLIRDRVLFRQSGNLLPYSEKQSQQLFTVKTGIAEHGHNFTQTRVTGKGIEWIAQRYVSELGL